MNDVFNDYEGNSSSMNFVWLISIITIMATWSYLSLKLNSIQHVTSGDALWFVALFSGKVIQGFTEKKFPSGKSGSGMLQNPEGSFSISRFVWVACVLGFVFIWSYLALKNSALQHFTTGDAGWFTALFGSKVGGTAVERYAMQGGDGDSDSDYGSERSFSSTDSSKDTLIKQLQETVKVQSEFNKNLVEKIDPKDE